MKSKKIPYKLNIALICLLLLLGAVLAGCSDSGEDADSFMNGEINPDKGNVNSTTVTTDGESSETNGSKSDSVNTEENFTKNETENNQTSAAEKDAGSTGNSAKTGFNKYTIVLDPGHGGPFSGASYDGRTEKNLTLKLAEYVRAELNSTCPELTVLLTREDDSVLSSDVVEDLELRCEFGKANNAEVLISLHFNASEKHNQTGACAYVSRRSNANEEGTLFGEKILEELSRLGIKNNGVQTRKSNDMMDETGDPYDYYAINRHASNRNYPGIIIEHCFIDNDGDIVFIDSDEDLKALAAADAAGILEALKVLSEK